MWHAEAIKDREFILSIIRMLINDQLVNEIETEEYTRLDGRWKQKMSLNVTSLSAQFLKFISDATE